MDASCQMRGTWPARKSSPKTTRIRKKRRKMPWLTASVDSPPIGDQAILDPADPADDFVEGLAAVERVVGLVAVLGHPSRPPAQALVLQGSSPNPSDSRSSRRPPRSRPGGRAGGDQLGGLPRAAQGAGEDASRLRLAQALGHRSGLLEAVLGQPVTLIAWERHRPRRGVGGGFAVADEVDQHQAGTLPAGSGQPPGPSSRALGRGYRGGPV